MVGRGIALVILILLPLAGYLAIRFFEGIDSFMGVRAHWYSSS